MKKTVLFLSLLVLGACGSDGDGGGGSAQCTKTIQSEWTATSVNFTADLRDVQLGVTGNYFIVFGGGETCELTGQIVGGACSGEIQITGSTYAGGGSGDPGCAALVETSSYEIVDTTMTACDVNDASDCLVYQ
jgi:hypothetical protein